MINEKVSEVQERAFKQWNKTKKGILAIATGVGKTFISFKAIQQLPRGAKILFLAETTRREETLSQELDKYNELYNIDLKSNYNIAFACYQGAYRWKNTEWDLVIADEVHECGQSYTTFFKNNRYKQLMGLSATTNNNSKYLVQGVYYTKSQYLHTFIAPIVFHYTLNQALKDGITRKSTIYVAEHTLNDDLMNIKITDTFYQTEAQYYKHWNDQFNAFKKIEEQSGYLTSEQKFSMEKAIKRRADILYKLPSKVNTVKKIISSLEGQTLVFANSLELLNKITPNVVSSKNKKHKNEQILNDFNNKKLSVIGSYKILQQGENLKHLDNIIIASYYGVSGQSIQRIGRLRRSESEGKIIFIKTKNTKEEDWLNKILQEFEDFEVKKY